MSHLAPCPTCNRHVDVAEFACPFCAAPLAESFRAQPRPAPPPRRLSRAAMMAVGATLMGACSSGDAIGGKTATDAAQDRPVATQDSHFMPLPAYGISLPPGTGGTLGTGGASGTGGSSGTTDAATDGASDAAPARDAAQDRSVIAIYGAAFAGDRTSDEPQS
jgi:hypothetical protein